MPKTEKISKSGSKSSKSSYNKSSKSSSKTVAKVDPRDKSDIRNICFENINDDYAWGKYGEFEVIMMKSNGYVNATKLCTDAMDETGSKKPFRNWKANSNTEEILNAISLSAEIPADELLITPSGLSNQIRGTYAHPDLIPHIASWASPTFAVMVSKIVNEYFTKQEIDRKNKVIRKQKRLLGEKNEKIDELSDKVDKLLTKNDKLLTKNDKMDNRIKRLLKKNDDLKDQNNEILAKIDDVNNDRVISTGSSKDEHMLVIIKNNIDPEEYDEDEDLYDYYALRVMRKSYKTRLADHVDRCPNMEILLKINYSPNSMNLWTRIKNKLSHGKRKKIDIAGCKFNLVKKYTEEQMKNDILQIHNERLEADD